MTIVNKCVTNLLHMRLTGNLFDLQCRYTHSLIAVIIQLKHQTFMFYILTIGTSSSMKGPSLPVLNKVRNFFDTINLASDALWGIFKAFCSTSNWCSIRLSKSFSSSTLPSNSLSVVYSARCTSVTISCNKQLLS